MQIWIYGVIVLVVLVILILIVRAVNKRKYKSGFGIIERARNRARDGCDKIIDKIRSLISGC